MRCKICNVDTDNLDYCNDCNNEVNKIIFEQQMEDLVSGEVPVQLDLEDYIRDLDYKDSPSDS